MTHPVQLYTDDISDLQAPEKKNYTCSKMKWQTMDRGFTVDVLKLICAALARIEA
jgi:hypothetical protein